MRSAGRLLVVVLLAGACTSAPADAPRSAPETPTANPIETPTGTETPTPSPSGDPSPSHAVEPDMPTTFAKDLEPAEVPMEALVPEGSDVTGQWFGFTDDGVVILVAWAERGSDPFRLPRGIALWRRSTTAPHWRAALIRRHRGREGITEIQVSTGDMTGDGSDDALVFEGVGGSGACGRWLVIDLIRTETTFRKELCDGRIEPAPPGSSGLSMTESVFRQGDAHCCPSAIRETTLAWNGSAWRVTSRSVTST